MESSKENETEYNSEYNYNYYNYYDYYNYNNTPKGPTVDSPTCRDATCIILSTVLVIIFILGVAGNAVVIWIAGFKLKKSVITIWYLSLAVSDLLFCCTLPITVVYRVIDNWVFGLFMCKFISFIMFLNMFSSILLLVIISVDRCVAVMFPVWAPNQRTIRKASVMVLLIWIISAVLSTPSAIFLTVHLSIDTSIKTCFNDYSNYHKHISVVAYRFVLGFLIPFLIIIVCYVVIIRKLKINQSARSKKPFKIMTALIVTFFICWTPHHIVALMELNHRKYESILPVGQVIGLILASANSCLNPFLYAFMGKDFERKCPALLSKIENAIEEEGRSSMRETSITTSWEKIF